MKRAKTLGILLILGMLIMFSAPVYGADNLDGRKDKESYMCQDCELVEGIENLLEFASDNMKHYLLKRSYLKRHLLSSSPISQDTAHLSHLKDDNNKKVILWFNLFEF
jgi:hypothetical protein